jgi:hypothetical protein
VRKIVKILVNGIKVKDLNLNIILFVSHFN